MGSRSRLINLPTLSVFVCLLSLAGLVLPGCGDRIDRDEKEVARSAAPRATALLRAATISDPLERASYLIEEGQAEAALSLLGELSAARPGDVQLCLLEVRAHAELVDVPRASARLEECKELGPEQPEVWVSACTLSYDTKAFARAVEECTRAIELTGAADDDYYAHLNRGLARVVLGALDGAYEDFQRCKQIDPSNAEAYYDESWVWAARGDIERTIENVRAAGARNPYYASRAVVAGDLPYRAFLEEPRWQEFLSELSSSTPRFHIPALLRESGISGVPQDSTEQKSTQQ